MTRASTLRLPTLLSALFLLLAFAAHPARAYDPWTAKPTVIFGMPLLGDAVGPDGTGVINAILRRVFEPEGVVYEHEVIPYSMTTEMLQMNKITCTLDIEERRTEFLHGAATVAFYDLAAARRSGDGWDGVGSIAGRRAAFLHGFAIDAVLKVDFEPQRVFHLVSAIHMLDQKIVDFVLDDQQLLEHAIRHSGLPPHYFAVSPIRSYDVKAVFVNTDEGRMYRDLFDRRMAQLKRTGQLAEILLEHGMSEAYVERMGVPQPRD